jgi:hypothetical protein
MKKIRNYIPLIPLLILTLLLTACNADGGVSIDSLTGIQAQSSSPGSDKQIEAPNDSTAGQSADVNSSNIEDRSSSKLIADSPDDSDSSELHLYCEITAVTETTFTACGETYEVDKTDDLTTMFTVGEFYEIEYLLNDDGTITILKYELEDHMDSSYSDDSSDDDLDDDEDSNDENDDHNDDNNDDNNYNNNNNNSENDD